MTQTNETQTPAAKIERLTAERDEYRDEAAELTAERDADVKRLTAERDEARASYQGLVRQLVAGKTLRDLRAEEN